MKTYAHLQLLDAKGTVLHRRSVADGSACDTIDGDTAARTALVKLSIETRPEPEFGSPAALASYRSQSMRELAHDQLRRGLEITGAYDPTVRRCFALSPEGGRCTLSHTHASMTSIAREDVGTDVDPHERCADTRRPREIAEVWTDADMVRAPATTLPVPGTPAPVVLCEAHQGQHTETPACVTPHYVAPSGAY